jgi:hypothetical protein
LLIHFLEDVMRNQRVFWGVIVLLIGVVFLVDNLGIININVWGIIWPIFLIMFGLQLFLTASQKRRFSEGEKLQLPLDGAQQAEIRFDHGAGRLNIGSGAGPNCLLEGDFSGGVVPEHSIVNQKLNLRLRPPTDFGWMPWIIPSPQGYTWTIRLSDAIPLRLELKTGASETSMDLTNLRVEDVRVDTGASSTRIFAPARAGYTRMDIHSGAASMDIRIPSGVSAKIWVKGGLSSINVDTHRFFQSGDRYESPDYATAQNRVDVTVETGVGSVTIQ